MNVLYGWRKCMRKHNKTILILKINSNRCIMTACSWCPLFFTQTVQNWAITNCMWSFNMHEKNINVSDLGQSKYRSAITQRADLGQSPVVECQTTFPLPPFSGHSQLQQTVFHIERTAHPVSQKNKVLFYITAISKIRTTNTPLILYYPTQLGNGQSLANMHFMFCWQRQEERY